MPNQKNTRNTNNGQQEPHSKTKSGKNRKPQKRAYDPKFRIEIADEFKEVKSNGRMLRLKFMVVEEGKKKVIILDVDRSILNSAADLHKALLEKGYRGNRKAVKDQLDNLIAQEQERIIPSTRQTGLINGALVTRYANLIIPAADGQPVSLVSHKDSPPPKACRKGDAERGLSSLKPLLKHSTELTFGYLVGLAAPLGVLLGLEEGFVGIAYGQTTTGKSSLLRVAQSLSTIATEDKHLDGFENTPGRLLKFTIQTSGLVRCFGDVKTSRDGVNFEDFRTYGYSIAEGRYRQPMDDVSGDITLDYSIQLYATEDPIWKMPSKRKEAFQQSDLVRLVHIPIANQGEGGVFRLLPVSKHDRYFKKLDGALKANHGVIMPKWLEILGKKDIKKLKALHRKWMKKDFAKGSGIRKEQIRIARIFRFLLFVAKLASKRQLLPIDYKTAKENLYAQFDRVISCGPESHVHSENEEKILTNILSAVALFPEVEGAKDSPYDIERIGGFKGHYSDGRYCLFVHSSFLNRLEKTQRPKVKSILKNLSDQNVTHIFKHSDITKRVRYYVIPISNLNGERPTSSSSSNDFDWSRS